MFATIDHYVLGITERFAHFIQRNFGIKPILIALAGDILFACSLISRWFIPGVTVSMTVKIIDAVIFLATFWATVVIYPREEREIERSLSIGLSNSNKISPTQQTGRVFVLIIFALSLKKILNDLSLENFNTTLTWLGLLIAMYFIACDPLPPAPSRLRKLMNSIFGQTQVIRN